MKTGILIPSVSRRSGGAYDAVRGLARALAKPPELGIEVFGLVDEFTQKDIVGWEPLPVKTFKIHGPKAFGYSPDLAPALGRSALDLLHSHGSWMYPSVASLKWARHCNKPYLISLHGLLDPWAVRNSWFKKRIAGLLFENSHLRGAVCLHALCESEVQAIRAYGLKNPICVIPNGVEPPDVSRVNPLPWHDVLPKGAKVLLYFGRLHPKKGIRNLLEAWDLIQKQKTKAADLWHLVIAGWGQGNHGSELMLLSRQLGLQDKVHFVGPKFGIDKQATYAHADALILPSLSEGLPMVVLEAWSYGLPVLMTPFCNLPEGFKSGSAIQIQTGPLAIREGIETLFVMTDVERANMGMQGRKLVKENFEWGRISTTMRNVYEWILGGGPPPPCIMTA